MVINCRLTLYLVMTVTAAALCSAPVAEAFHEGGVGYCDGCHTLHGNNLTDPDDNTSSALLKGSDPSSTCLGCHADSSHEYAIFNDLTPAQTAAGDFSWLQDPLGQGSNGSTRGHNIIARDFGLYEDGLLQYAPGGDYPAASLQCISCHDPHGQLADASNPMATSGSGSYGSSPPDGESQLGNFRLLGGTGYASSGQTSFTADAPIAVAPTPGSGPESDNNHTAYGQGMSEWCANCHADLLDNTTVEGSAKHPSGNEAKLNDQMILRYNSYISTGDLSGSQAVAYSSLVPFEIGTDDIGQLDPSSTSGPGSNANVMCLTCHRAHASAFTNSGRWDFETTILASSQTLEGYYGRNLEDDYGPYQRQFCTKCHPYD